MTSHKSQVLEQVDQLVPRLRAQDDLHMFGPHSLLIAKEFTSVWIIREKLRPGTEIATPPMGSPMSSTGRSWDVVVEADGSRYFRFKISLKEKEFFGLVLNALGINLKKWHRAGHASNNWPELSDWPRHWTGIPRDCRDRFALWVEEGWTLCTACWTVEQEWSKGMRHGVCDKCVEAAFRYQSRNSIRNLADGVVRNSCRRNPFKR